MQKKVFIKTFGCQMNEYDSDKMVDVLGASDGLVRTDTPEDADVILFNTCSIREKSQEKVFSDLGRIKELKRKKPELVIGVGGCVASQEGDAIVKRAPYVDVVFGPQTLHRLPQLIQDRRQSGKAQVDISFPEIEKFDFLPPAKVEGPIAYVSIMEGCSKYCSYCVVPYTRGEEVSRRFEDVLTEVAGLAAQGVKEIMLLGQNVNAFRGAMESGETADFALLLEYIAEIPGIERLRFVTSHPKEFSQRLIDAYARIPQLVSHLYLPVQHGSDRVLNAMKRGYTGLEYKSIIRRLRAVRPDMTFSSDFIVGFPGETEADFEAMMKLVEDVNFDNSFSFIFSKRPGTPAANLEDDTPHEVKLARLQRLQALIDLNTRKHSAAMVGTVQRVLVEGVAKKDATQLQGRAENNRVVLFPLDETNASLIGQLADVRIVASHDYYLRGELVANLDTIAKAS
ncbi:MULTISPECIES: tRNA (N6-isopentenyl adenosine(37)-C2)-methylthiotransferase MiaB [Massilia]|uniref:tRNA-2-methylthio-N(6)-dimethylallyladenosine synthase n=2 Tax=Massilia TaxID=149698 RepID=A0A422QDM3_9BURK|nr:MULTISPECIES: tRNA (N6-isopentenyl adenosine(37)-C2)-methylthiotransferase MiaB [Massilia]MDY0961404.1 tRNA (N6-isopentenyl adenosine(37)-C2)-methylthiotransferase MiaB [Massilia sp. CFBP9026]RNF28130.1 (dimethylallyl)adenosine tRNA methylthiotransferase [Massilia aurea]TXG02041.1 tRNA (N6-isopentenyl adenosine(37)-C2)-methylthiotransferase MiaB [Massilia arenae]